MWAMKPIRLLVAVCALVALAACYTSEKPLISEAESVAPYATMTFQASDGSDPPSRFTRIGKHYVTKQDGDVLTLNLKRDGDYYVAQFGGKHDDQVQYLYGYMKLDPAAGTAQAFRIIGTKTDVRDGLRLCEGVICVDSLDAYVAYAREQASTGKPEDTLKFTAK
jgi:hypothetical protein